MHGSPIFPDIPPPIFPIFPIFPDIPDTDPILIGDCGHSPLAAAKAASVIICTCTYTIANSTKGDDPAGLTEKGA